MEWTVTQKGKPMLLLDGFAYVYGKKMKNGGEIWRCRMKRLGCSAVVHVNKERDKILDMYPSSYHKGHGVDYGECNSLKLKRRWKENSICLDAKPEKVLITTVNQSQDLIGNECAAKLPQKESIRRNIRRQQASVHPRPPQSLKDINDILKKYEFIDDQRFLQKDITTNAGTRILIFGTTSSLQVLGIGTGWLSDGTFKVVPSMFSQLYTIHSFVDGVWTPGIYALISSKNKEAYIDLLHHVKELIETSLLIKPSPLYVLSDFELSFMKAAAEVFPNTQIFGCLFHFGQMVWRHAQKAGLQSALSQSINAKLRSDLHSIIALAFVPTDDVANIFDDLVDNIDPRLAPVVAHVHEYYVHGRTVGRKQTSPLFPPSVWNCYERVVNDLPRTTNILEGFHNKLNRLCETNHLNLFLFISKLQDVEHDALFDRILALNGQITRSKSSKQTKLDKRIKERVVQYQEFKAQGRLLAFLSSLGYLFMGSAFTAFSSEDIVLEEQQAEEGNESDDSKKTNPSTKKDTNDGNKNQTSNASNQTMAPAQNAKKDVTHEDEDDVIAVLPKPAIPNAITWQFDPPGKFWQEETCKKNNLDFVSETVYSGRGSKINPFTIPSLKNIVDVNGDGNCLFRALSLVTTGTEKSHIKVRKLICEHMVNINFIVNGKFPAEYLKCSKMEEDRVWGTTDELLVASSWLKVPIFVWHRFGKTHCWHCHDVLKLGRNSKNAIYLNNASGCHFQVVTGL